MKTHLYKTDSQESKQKLYNVLKDLQPGQYVITIKKNRAIRSLSQNRYYHAILNIIAIATGHTHEELHEAMKMKFNCSVIYFPKGGSQIVGKSTSDLDSGEFVGYVNRVKQWAMDEFSIVIPERESIDEHRWIDIENTYDENFNG